MVNEKRRSLNELEVGEIRGVRDNGVRVNIKGWVERGIGMEKF